MEVQIFDFTVALLTERFFNIGPYANHLERVGVSMHPIVQGRGEYINTVNCLGSVVLQYARPNAVFWRFLAFYMPHHL